MKIAKFFTDAERERLEAIHKQLFTLAAEAIEEGDEAKIQSYLVRATEKGLLQRDAFGINPILSDCETALVVGQEIGLSRGSILGVLLNSAVMSGAASLDDIRKDFGDEVANILHGLMRIRELYAKSATVKGDNFRSLLVTFAEDMRVILIMIANRVCIMRQIKGTKNVEAQKQVAMEAAYLYAPLAHKLGLYKLKSELEDLSLKYLEHDAYYHIKDKLNETKRSRDAYIERFLKPIDEKLKAAGLHYHMKGRTKSIHSIWQKMQKQQVDVNGVYDLFAIRIILDSAPEKEKMECWQVFSIITDMYQ
ncbi:MAG: bifunctional (p)ppGpp synthetase/guanosine-3',5'-bis(diphosphate) 3'-pyrophosphohydrolase, partial [Bacteroidaceae bacterium]|nr:bifunctional (p)ppGpp synthetase/guanosine-3',5'-bis(diphosphate) 3'-pyrophosphohydrolase [Bacteroidaceae bacterium]